MERSGAELRDVGMAEAVDHADEAVPSWSDRALKAIRRFLNESALANGEFMTEDFRLWAYQNAALPRPPSHRAWGAVVVKARSLALIDRVRLDSVKNPKAHRANATVWRRGTGASH